MTYQTPDIAWRDDRIPIATRFDDPYFSLNDGLAETRHVFLQGNDLPHRLQDGFHIAELGFGTGLNFLATYALWLQNPKGTLYYTGFEAYPMACADMARALHHFEETAALAPLLLANWPPAGRPVHLPHLTLHIIAGDAGCTLPPWPHKADAWFLDGFSPAKNPGLWSDEVLHQVGLHTAPQGSFATYTAAGHVRRALQKAGFQVERTKGHGTKRHMSKGIFTPS